jgi:2-polyprenyl-6-methoxyphenol hydroxylase-like FAD-dependent oxidoreductase
MSYDAIVVGGGLAGSSLADRLARAGHRVLVLERETQFKDRVRGENMLPWGVAAAKRIGIYETLIAAGGHAAPNWFTYVMGQVVSTRDLPSTTPNGDAMLNIYHPDLQEAVIALAMASGADVKRGATVLGLDAGPGRAPSVTYEYGGKSYTETARIVVGADGRASQMRAWGGFEVRRNPELLTIAGMRIEGTHVPERSAFFCMGPGVATFWAPQGNKRARTYFVYPGVAGKRGLSGKQKIGEFLQAAQLVGTPESWLSDATSIGPLAEFEAADRWVESPAKNGVVLIGDAAASTDPSWGSGLSLTMLDVECLGNALTSTNDWNSAIADYAKAHDEYYGALHRILSWMTELVWTPGPEADARRARVMPRMISEPRGFPDNVGLGPFGPSDEQARRLVLGLD